MPDLECPPISELFGQQRSAAATEHVSDCPRCQVLLASQDNAETEIDYDDARLGGFPLGPTQVEQPRSPEVGTVAIASVEALEERIVALVLGTDSQELIVAPVSDEPVMATEWDLILSQETLGYPAMAELWNFGAVRLEQIVELRATLTDEFKEWAERLYGLALASETAPDDAPVGVPVLGESDPRLAFQEIESERVRPFWEPAGLLAGVDSLGELVRSRREELGVEVASLDELVEAKGWLGQLETDALDIHGTVPVPAMAKLMRELNIQPFEAVAEMVRKAVEASSEASPRSVAFARRRSKGKPRVARADPDERRQRADRYVQELWRTLQEK